MCEAQPFAGIARMVRFWHILGERLESALCSRWPTTRRIAEGASIRPLRELGYVSVLQRISRSPPGDSTRRGTLRELALMPVD